MVGQRAMQQPRVEAWLASFSFAAISGGCGSLVVFVALVGAMCYRGSWQTAFSGRSEAPTFTFRSRWGGRLDLRCLDGSSGLCDRGISARGGVCPGSGTAEQLFACGRTRRIRWSAPRWPPAAIVSLAALKRDRTKDREKEHRILLTAWQSDWSSWRLC